MDTFMDKLAQKLTAQEIIKANTAADMEELNKLKNQIAEYNECLAKLQKLVDNASVKLVELQAQNREKDSLAAQGLEGIQALQRQVGGLGQAQSELAEQQAQGMEALQKQGEDTAARLVAQQAQGLEALQKQGEDTAARLTAQQAQGMEALQKQGEDTAARLTAQQAQGLEALQKQGEDTAARLVAQQAQGFGKLQKLMDNVTAKLAEQPQDEEKDSLAAKGLEEIQALQRQLESLGQAQEMLAEKFAGLDKSVAWQIEFLTKTVGDKVDQLSEQGEIQAGGQLEERLETLEDAVHKECVKVYRNVQAVVTEESGKQESALTETREDMSSVRGKINVILVFSVLAMLMSLGGLAFQVLCELGIILK